MRKRDKIIIPKAIIKAKNKNIIELMRKRDKIIIPKAIIKAKNKNIIQLMRLLAVEILGVILAMSIYGWVLYKYYS